MKIFFGCLCQKADGHDIPNLEKIKDSFFDNKVRQTNPWFSAIDINHCWEATVTGGLGNGGFQMGQCNCKKSSLFFVPF